MKTALIGSPVSDGTAPNGYVALDYGIQIVERRVESLLAFQFACDRPPASANRMRNLGELRNRRMCTRAVGSVKKCAKRHLARRLARLENRAGLSPKRLKDPEFVKVSA